MRESSVTALVHYVANIEQTKGFYAQLGLPIRVISDSHIRITQGSVELEFHDERFETIEEFATEARRRPKGAGLYVYVKVGDLSDLHKELLSKRVRGISSIARRPWGNEEFIATDPDGYKLVFYRKAL